MKKVRPPPFPSSTPVKPASYTRSVKYIIALHAAHALDVRYLGLQQRNYKQGIITPQLLEAFKIKD